MWLKCDYCGKEYRTYNTPRGVHHYCSKVCAWKGHSTKQKVYCEWCGEELYRRIIDIRNNKHFFCSKNCYDARQSRDKIQLVCKTCGKSFYRSPSWLKQKSGYYCSLSCRNMSQDWKEKSCVNANLIQCRKKGLNNLEKAGNAILDSLGVQYETQYLINNKICVDVYIKDKNLIIQWDGDYWHGKGKKIDEVDERVRHRMLRDKSQDVYLATCGFIILRFWESDVYKNKEYVYDTIKRSI